MDKRKEFNLAVYISGGGSNLKAIYQNTISGDLKSKVKLVFSSKEEAKGLAFARSEKIASFYLNRKNFATRTEFRDFQLKYLEEYQIDYILLCGYLKKLNPSIVEKYQDRILNIHPALLPKFGGKGMHGMNVHRAVISAKEAYSGATIHFVNNKYDDGRIFLAEKVKISEDETAETLQKKVLAVEHQLFSKAIKKLEEL